MKGLLLLVLVVGLAPPLVAQDPRLAARLDSTTLSSVTSYIDSSRRDGVPTEPLIQKALEGASKGAPGDRIAAAVRSLGGLLRTARTALGSESSDREIVAGAAALRAGAAPEGLRSLRQVRGAANLEVPLAVLADLVALGVRVESAYASVMDLARTRASDPEFLRLKDRQLERRRP